MPLNGRLRAKLLGYTKQSSSKFSPSQTLLSSPLFFDGVSMTLIEFTYCPNAESFYEPIQHWQFCERCTLYTEDHGDHDSKKCSDKARDCYEEWREDRTKEFWDKVASGLYLLEDSSMFFKQNAFTITSLL
jgi:hypothetical protein